MRWVAARALRRRSSLAAAADDDAGQRGRRRASTVVRRLVAHRRAERLQPHFEGADVRLSFARLRRARRPDPPGREAGRLRRRPIRSLPEQLACRGPARHAGRVRRPTSSSIALPARRHAVEHVEDLAAARRRAARSSAETVPVGAVHARGVGQLPAGGRGAITSANVRSEEPDVQGRGRQAHARARPMPASSISPTSPGRTSPRVELPPDLQPTVAYGARRGRGAKQTRSCAAALPRRPQRRRVRRRAARRGIRPPPRGSRWPASRRWRSPSCSSRCRCWRSSLDSPPQRADRRARRARARSTRCRLSLADERRRRWR